MVEESVLFDATFRTNEQVVDFVFENTTLEPGQRWQLRLETDQTPSPFADWHKMWSRRQPTRLVHNGPREVTKAIVPFHRKKIETKGWMDGQRMRWHAEEMTAIDFLRHFSNHLNEVERRANGPPATIPMWSTNNTTPLVRLEPKVILWQLVRPLQNCPLRKLMFGTMGEHQRPWTTNGNTNLPVNIDMIMTAQKCDGRHWSSRLRLVGRCLRSGLNMSTFQLAARTALYLLMTLRQMAMHRRFHRNRP